MNRPVLIGLIVAYVLTAEDARAINARLNIERNTGSSAEPGEIFPAIVTRVHSDASLDAPERGRIVNLQVLIDGNGSHWVERAPYRDDRDGLTAGTWYELGIVAEPDLDLDDVPLLDDPETKTEPKPKRSRAKKPSDSTSAE